MKFGVREICDVVFKAKAPMRIGANEFNKGQPVLYIDSAKTSTLEGAATSVYATGGAGNTRLVAWEGEKTLTFTVEDALLSPISFSMLSGAGLFKGKEEEVHVHTTAATVATKTEIDLTEVLGGKEGPEKICGTAPIFVTKMDADGSLTGELISGLKVDSTGKKLTGSITLGEDEASAPVFVDFYITKKSANVSEIQIDAAHFGGYFYVEASTLFRRVSDGVDMPAEITLPNVKIQSNFSFSMAATGDPSTFTFTMDAFPGYTMFNPTKKVLCVMQVIEDAKGGNAETMTTVMPHTAEEKSANDSVDEGAKAAQG